MKKGFWFRLGMVAVTVPVLLTSYGCNKEGSTSDKSKSATSNTTKKKAELSKTPYKNEEFGTGSYVQFLIYDKGHGEADFEIAKTALNELAAKFEVHEQGISEFDKINAQSGIKPVTVSKETFELVQALESAAKSSKGLYNPAIFGVSSLWNIGFPEARVPSDEEIKARLDKVNYKDIEVNKKNQSVFLKKKGMAIQSNGMGKGFLGEKLLKTLADRGVTTAVVNLGGHAYTMGENPNRKDGAWEVGIANPNLGETQDSPLVGILTSKHSSFNTTNYYGRYLKEGDKVYSHLFDSKTGYPVETDLLSVTIVGDNAPRDDAYSNALFNMGLKEGMKYVNAHDDIDAIFITKDKKVHISENIPGEFKLLDKSFKIVEGK